MTKLSPELDSITTEDAINALNNEAERIAASRPVNTTHVPMTVDQLKFNPYENIPLECVLVQHPNEQCLTFVFNKPIANKKHRYSVPDIPAEFRALEILALGANIEVDIAKIIVRSASIPFRYFIPHVVNYLRNEHFKINFPIYYDDQRLDHTYDSMDRRIPVRLFPIDYGMTFDEYPKR